MLIKGTAFRRGTVNLYCIPRRCRAAISESNFFTSTASTTASYISLPQAYSSAPTLQLHSRSSVHQSIITTAMFKPTAPLLGRIRRLRLTTKQVNGGYYKGNRTGPMGWHTKHGDYILDWDRVRTYVVPEGLDFFKVRLLRS